MDPVKCLGDEIRKAQINKESFFSCEKIMLWREGLLIKLCLNWGKKLEIKIFSASSPERKSGKVIIRNQVEIT